MLIIPADRPLDWKRPPVLTLCLIVVNALIYFGYQGGDEARWQAAMRYYAESGLAEREVPHYLAFAQARGEALPEDLGNQDYLALSVRLNQDGAFLKALHAGAVIPPDDPEHAGWQDRRQRFEALEARISAKAWGLSPAEPSPLHWLSHAFLHGDFGHLAGNMLFLFIFGAALEHALGRRRLLAAYLVSAAAGGLAHTLANWGSAAPLVGASGAISGLMGAFTVWFGMRRIQFFYWLGFYFGYLRLPALVMLPFWLGKELFEAMASPGGPVAYFAHVGGMLAGAGLGLLWRRGRVHGRDEVPERVGKDVGDAYAAALEHIGQLRFTEAKALLYAQLQRQGLHLPALEQLYKLELMDPASEAYHALARRVLTLPHKRADVDALVLRLFRDYRARARPRPRLTAEAMQLLAARFLRMGELGEVEGLLDSLARSLPDAPGTRQLRLELARDYLERGQGERGRELLRDLKNQSPDTDQGRLATQLLNRTERS